MYALSNVAIHVRVRVRVRVRARVCVRVRACVYVDMYTCGNPSRPATLLGHLGMLMLCLCIFRLACCAGQHQD